MNNPYWFTTFTGKKFYPFDPLLEDICIEDIAHALSLICRFGGHLPEHYSVAQHSVLVSYLVPTEYRLEGLLHDAAEAYIGDIVRPIKRHPLLAENVNRLESAIARQIQVKFRLGHPILWGVDVKKADTIALLTEKRDLFHVAKDQIWNNDAQIANVGEDLKPVEGIKLQYVHPAIAEQQFLHRFYELERK